MSYHSKSRPRRRRGIGFLPVLIVLLIIVAAVMAYLLVLSNPLGGGDAPGGLPFNPGQNSNFIEVNATQEPLVLGTNAPDVTPVPTPVPEGAPVVEVVEDVDVKEENVADDLSARLIPTPQPGDYFLPVFDRALRTPNDEMMIAITIDYCHVPEKMQKIIELASKYGAKMTLFPTGEALMTEGMTSGFRTCVQSYGFEIENHCYSRRKDYALSSGELGLQIWKQAIAASYAMGRDYQEHFFRPYHIKSVGDQRMHFFLRKMGYLGVGGYTHSYKDFKAVEEMVATIENGKIYAFDMTDRSMGMIEEFMAEVQRRGYKMVTMNRLFGLEENTISNTLTINEQELPGMEDYIASYYPLKLNDHTYAVYGLQTRLMQLGYMTGDVKADGIYGASTSVAVSAFQAKIGVPATGNADVVTQEKLFSLDAPAA